MTKYCKAKTGKIWYVYGFNFVSTVLPNRNAIVCCDHQSIFKKRNDVILIEAESSIKEILLSANHHDRNVAYSLLESILKDTPNPEIVHYQKPKYG